MQRLEAQIERAFYREIILWADRESINLQVLKMTVVGRRGYPDRMLMWWPKQVLFIEFKRPGEEPRPLQEYIHQELRQMGFTVFVFDDLEEALNDTKTYISTTTIAAKGFDVVDEREWS